MREARPRPGSLRSGVARSELPPVLVNGRLWRWVVDTLQFRGRHDDEGAEHLDRAVVAARPDHQPLVAGIQLHVAARLSGHSSRTTTLPPGGGSSAGCVPASTAGQAGAVTPPDASAAGQGRRSADVGRTELEEDPSAAAIPLRGLAEHRCLTPRHGRGTVAMTEGRSRRHTRVPEAGGAREDRTGAMPDHEHAAGARAAAVVPSRRSDVTGTPRDAAARASARAGPGAALDARGIDVRSPHRPTAH